MEEPIHKTISAPHPKSSFKPDKDKPVARPSIKERFSKQYSIADIVNIQVELNKASGKQLQKKGECNDQSQDDDEFHSQKFKTYKALSPHSIHEMTKKQFITKYKNDPFFRAKVEYQLVSLTKAGNLKSKNMQKDYDVSQQKFQSEQTNQTCFRMEKNNYNRQSKKALNKFSDFLNSVRGNGQINKISQ